MSTSARASLGRPAFTTAAKISWGDDRIPAKGWVGFDDFRLVPFGVAILHTSPSPRSIEAGSAAYVSTARSISKPLSCGATATSARRSRRAHPRRSRSFAHAPHSTDLRRGSGIRPRSSALRRAFGAAVRPSWGWRPEADIRVAPAGRRSRVASILPDFRGVDTRGIAASPCSRPLRFREMARVFRPVPPRLGTMQRL